MNTKSVSFDDVFVVKGFNHRKVPKKHVDGLAASIARHGLLSLLTCTATTRPSEEGEDSVPTRGYQVVDGEARFLALTSFLAADPAGFEEKFPGKKMTINLVSESEASKLRDKSVISNTYHNPLAPHEIYAEVRRRSEQEGLDTYEIGQVMNLQQPRVSEYLSFARVIQAGHVLWAKGKLSNTDMVKLAALEEDAQETWIEEFRAAMDAAGDDEKAAKAAKATARKNLKQTTEEEGSKREYANAGKPSRKTLASYKPWIAVFAHDEDASEEHRVFYNAVAAAFQVMDGEIDFDALSPTKSYVTKKAAKEALKLLSDAEAAEEEKAAKKAEREERKAAKAAEKAEKAKPAKKATKKKTAKKKAAKKGGRKRSAAAAETSEETTAETAEE